jgi:endo-1,4-beta-xylanase
MNVNTAMRLSLLSCILCIIGPQPALAANLLTNPGFESGTTDGWTCWGNSLAIISGTPQSGLVHGGWSCVLASNRAQTWQGPVQSILGRLTAGKTYRFCAWVKLLNAASDHAGITIVQTDDAGTNYYGAGSATVYRDCWTLLTGTFTLTVKGTLTRLDMYIEGPQPGVSFYADDLCVEQIADWRDVVAARTEQNRKRDASITILSPKGLPVAGAAVHVQQTKHDFAFGSCINYHLFDSSRPNRYGDFFASHFEWAVCENESKWYSNEPTQGHVTYDMADRIYDWCHNNGIIMRGTCLYWAVDGMVQNWLKALNTAQLLSAVEGRMDSAVNHFKGKFVHWDINNEMIPGHFYKDHLGDDIRVWMFQRAHEIDPNCRLFVNEYNVIEGGYDLDKCLQLVRGLLDDGAPVDAIGAQCHFAGGFDRWGVIDRLDTLATLGLPIWCTEFDVADANECVRADDLEAFYRIAFSHPAVEGILMWGFWEKSHWKANCHIVNTDWSLNEAGRRYEALLKEWTTETDGVTGPNGVLTFRGFHGTYDLTITPPAGQPMTTTLLLPPGPDPAEFTVTVE